MNTRRDELLGDALGIWQAGVDAVRSDRLVTDVLRVDGDCLLVGDHALPLAGIGRIAVVGCGKAGAGMARGVEAALGSRWLAEKQVSGWLNVPDDCVVPLERIHLHGSRPAGVNEPTAEGVAGAEQILMIVSGLHENDVCLCLLSGGGSALLPAPVEGITLQDKLAVTRHLSSAGANIRQLNTVRKQLSRLKGGGLARACRARRMFSLIISDVLGDPLEIIASGPTVVDSSTPAEALEILEQFQARQAGISAAVFASLRQAVDGGRRSESPGCEVVNRVIGSNATAVGAAADEAQRRGYDPRRESASQLEGDAEPLGRALADQAAAMRQQGGRRCLVSGGEPTVRLVERSRRGLGGRNQQLVLAGLERWLDRGETAADGIVFLSGGTDGEDGPTDAAGAWWDQEVLRRARQQGLSPSDYLQRNDAYHFFQPLDALLRTGPTHTNVCDLRIVVTAGAVESHPLTACGFHGVSQRGKLTGGER